MTSDETFISIMGDSVPAQHQEMNIWELSFLSDNPRVYAAIKEIESFSSLTTDEQQHCIYKRILQEPSVKNLIPEIKRDGGLQEPIIVRYDTRQVIEGNSRLAVYRKLYSDTHENEQWRSIRCLVVKSLTDDQQTRLLGQTHLRGKTEWSAHAKALFCYRWVEEKKKEEAELAKLSGFTANEIKKHAKAIKLMKENEDKDLSNHSYYDVLVRNKAISDAIEGDSNLRGTVMSQIKKKEKDFTAQEMRKKLPVVIKKPKILRKYAKGEVGLRDAYERADISDPENKLKTIRDRLDDIEQAEIKRLENNNLRAMQQTIKQINRILRRISNMVESSLDIKSTNSQDRRLAK